MMKKVLLVDEHPIARFAVRIYLALDGFDVIAEAGNGSDALSQVEIHHPDMIIMESRIPLMDEMVFINEIKSMPLPPNVVVFTAEHSYHHGVRCMQAGADGYVSKAEPIEMLILALRSAQSGIQYLPSKLFQDGEIDAENRLIECLPTRELQVLQQLARGRSNQEITERMMLNSKAVSMYKTRLLKKFHVDSLSDLIMIARRAGLSA